MKETGPEAVPPPAIFSREERIVERLLPAPEPNLNSIASVLARSMIEDIVSCDRVDEAGGALRLLFDADVEPDRRVERHLLVDDQVGQLGLEGLEVRVGREVVLGLGPGGDRVDDAVDQLADGGLALGRAEVAAEVLD